MKYDFILKADEKVIHKKGDESLKKILKEIDDEILQMRK